MQPAVDIIAFLRDIASDGEYVVTRIWFYLTALLMTVSSIILVSVYIIYPRTRTMMARASVGITLSYASIVIRSIVVFRSGQDFLPQPWSFLFWCCQLAFAVFFSAAIISEWVIPSLGGRRALLVVLLVSSVVVICSLLVIPRL